MEWEMRNGEWEMGNGKSRMGNEEWENEIENEIFPFSVLDLFFIVRKRYFFIDIQVFLPKYSEAKSNE